MSQRLRIATCNILHGMDITTGKVDIGAVVTGVAALDAAVVALQEVDREQPRSGGVHQARAVAEALGWHWAYGPALLGVPGVRWTAVPPRDPGGPAYGIALLSRLPLSAVRVHRLPGGGGGVRENAPPPQRPGWDREPRAALGADVTVDGRVVRVTNIHLSYMPWRGIPQLRAAARRARSDQPAAMLGDFNLPPGVVKRVLPGWRHANSEPTYPAWEPRLGIDQLAVRGPVTAGDVVVGPRGFSDHLPVTATLTLS